MKLNCKPGDLAVIVTDMGFRDCTDTVGKVFELGGIEYVSQRFGPKWNYVGPRQFDSRGRELHFIADACLRPIRDNDGEDETLQWLEVPRKVAA